MRVFVAGATGTIGRFLIPLLLAEGHEVTGGSRTEVGVGWLREQGAIGVRADVFDADGLRHAVAAAEPEVVMHQLTSLGEVKFSENARIRKEGTRNLVDAAKLARVRRIVAQSVAWVYEAGEGPADETVPLDVHAPAPRARGIAGVTALEGISTEIEHHVLLRYGLFYGPGTWYAPGSLVTAQLRAGEIAANAAVSSFVHVSDAARAAVLAIDWPDGPVNIVDDEPAAAREWVPVLAAALDAPVPQPIDGREDWERGADNTYAKSLGWQPEYPTWRTGFRIALG
jgi:nucleoside-diphosphate-sugar epimerase